MVWMTWYQAKFKVVYNRFESSNNEITILILPLHFTQPFRKESNPLYENIDVISFHQKTSVDLKDYWNPEVYIDNVVGEPKRTSFINVEHDANGQAYIVEKRRVKGAFMETMELWEFPFDVQVYLYKNCLFLFILCYIYIFNFPVINTK